MGGLDGFYTVWSNARSTLGQGSPQQGSAFDGSNQLRQLQTSVQSAAPEERWTGTASDAYTDANSKQGQALGAMAGLDQRLGAEVDRSAAVVTAGRRNLDAVKQWVQGAASTVPPGVDREQTLLPIARKGIGDVADIVKQTNSDLNAIGGRIRGIGNEYQALGGEDGKDPNGPKTQNLVGGGKFKENGGEYTLPDGSSPPGHFGFPNDPNIPPPPDSLPGGGRWRVGGEGYPSGPNGGPPTQPPPKGEPWKSKPGDLPIQEGRGSGWETIGTVPPNGWGEEPVIVGKESYRFQWVGESFNPDAPGHVQWVQQNDGKWYRAEWIDYQFEQEHRKMVGAPNIHAPPNWGANKWEPISIQDIYNIHNSNPKITIHIPDLCGQEFTIPPRP